MGINRVKRRGKERIEVRKRWPDGVEFRRFFDKAAEARQALSRIEGAIALGTWREYRSSLNHSEPVEAITFGDFSKRFLEEYAKVRCRSWKRYELSIRHLNRVLAEIPLQELTRYQLHSFVQKRSRQVSAASVNRDIACAKKLISFAYELGIIETHPLFRFRLLPEREKSRRLLTVEEFRKLVEAMPNTVMSAYVAVLGETGLRKTEALFLKWSEVDLREGLVMPERTKSNRVRLVPLSEYAVSWISRLTRYVHTPYVFVNPRTAERLKSPDKTFRRAAKGVGLAGLGFHDLRVFRGTQWNRMGVDMKTIQQMLGHADIKTTMRYVRYLDKALAEVREAQAREESAVCARIASG